MRLGLLPFRPAPEAKQAPPNSTAAGRETRWCRQNERSEARKGGEFKDIGRERSNFLRVESRHLPLLVTQADGEEHGSLVIKRKHHGAHITSSTIPKE